MLSKSSKEQWKEVLKLAKHMGYKDWVTKCEVMLENK
jgi:hypothetical protein